jgi:hypothetical protein
MNPQAMRQEWAGAGDLPGASELAQGLRELVERLPLADRIALRRLLGHDLAAQSVAALRHARLGLLIRLARGGFNGSPADYEAQRVAAGREGEQWPTAATLCNAYGHWHCAKRAALRFAEQGSRARVPHNLHHGQGRRPSPTRMDCLDAIRLARRALGAWPTEWEYLEWGQLERRAARLVGRSEPALPVAKSIRRAWGDYPTALAEAQHLEQG